MNRRSVLMSGAALALLPMRGAADAACDATDAANAAVVQRWIDEVWNAGNVDLLAELASPDFASPYPDDAPGVEAWQQRTRASRDAFLALIPNARFVIDETIAAGGKVAARGHIAGSNRSGKAIHAAWIDVITLKGEKIVSVWTIVDQSAVLGL